MINFPKSKIQSLPYENDLIINAFRDNQLVTGPHLDQFEHELSVLFQFKYACLVSSGYAGLFLALKSLDLNKARIVVPAYSTCHAITNAVLANDFEVIFCPLDHEHLSLSFESLEEIFQFQPCDAIIVPSHFGIPAPIEKYKKFGVPVIEDACQAFFTRTSLRSTADFVVFSFYPTKQFNCIDGGAVLCNNQLYADRINDLRYYDHQKSFDGKPRYNLRMPNIHAAFGCVLLNHLTEIKSKLLLLRETYINSIHCKKLLITAQTEPEVIPWRFLIANAELEFFKYLNSTGIQTDVELIQLNTGFNSSPHLYFSHCMRSIPFYDTMTQTDQVAIIKLINAYRSQDSISISC
jgi:dTDP-4-amino-4,6-dideoxygalactose transaminase